MQANILIDDNGNARLVDFGLSTIKAEFEGTSYSLSTVGGAIRWRARELLPFTPEDFTPKLTAACDVYSYGSIMLQVRTNTGNQVSMFFLTTPLDSFGQDPVPQLQVRTGAGRTLEWNSTAAFIIWPDD